MFRKKLFLSLCLSVGLISCNNSPNGVTINTHDSYGYNDIYENSLPANLTENTNIIVDIPGLEPVTKSEGFKIKVTPTSINKEMQRFKDDDEGKEDKEDKETDDKNFKPVINISDVRLPSGKSIVGLNSPDSIVPNYIGKAITLTITGTFKTSPKTDMEHMSFTYEPGLLVQSLVGNKPKVRVLLDDVILMNPVSASEKSITVSIDTKNIPDFYLKGLHKLTVVGGNYFSDTLVSVGAPEVPENLNLPPKIDKVEVLYDKDRKPVNLKLTGKNFMMYYRYSYSHVDGVFGFAHSTNILTGNVFETIVHLPNPKTFKVSDKHTIMYATPFGVAFKGF